MAQEGEPRNYEDDIARSIFDLNNYPPAGTTYDRDDLLAQHGIVFEIAQEAIDAESITAIRGIQIQVEATKTARTVASRNKDQGGAITLKKRLDQYQSLLALAEGNEIPVTKAPAKPVDTKKKSMSSSKSPRPITPSA